ncbi:hypothetical protein Btru_011925 [Bulinus truncatus]|nr:hypothetical protein Btru_011925 [Bulinus truncatus]
MGRGASYVSPNAGGAALDIARIRKTEHCIVPTTEAPDDDERLYSAHALNSTIEMNDRLTGSLTTDIEQTGQWSLEVSGGALRHYQDTPVVCSCLSKCDAENKINRRTSVARTMTSVARTMTSVARTMTSVAGTMTSVARTKDDEIDDR